MTTVSSPEKSSHHGEKKNPGLSPQRPPFYQAAEYQKRFGPVIALDCIDLAIYPGANTALVGDNGASKSTLIKIISGV